MAAPVTGQLVDLLGFLTGVVLYVMLVAMVWRERHVEGAPFLSRRGRLPLLTGLCGLIWNVGALASFGPQVASHASPPPFVVAAAFSALGFLPAVVVHSLLEGRETAGSRRLIRLVIVVAYGLSGTAAALHALAAADGSPVPSRPALWLLTVGFTTLTALLLVLTRHQPIGRRGVWVTALAVFAVSALHFGRHVGNEVWWVDLIGHHASLPLALAILHQGYRFALADLFLKNAIALLLLMALALGVFSTAMVPLLRWQDSAGAWDPRGVMLLVALWMATALTYPVLRRLAGRAVDRAVLRRPDYDVVLAQIDVGLAAADTEPQVVGALASVLRDALGAADVRAIDDPLPSTNRRLVVTGVELKACVPDPAGVLLLRLHTVEPPQPALLFGPLTAGRRLLSDDIHVLESAARVAARRIDALRVTQERVERNLREQAMQRLATEAELRALRAQLNPHFLFNALTTIGYLIQQAPPRAMQTLLGLTSVLRAVLRRSTTEFSTLEDEIAFIRSYLEIEHARYEERLEVEIDVSRAARHLAIPTLLLQPLVENAVKHGISPQVNGGRVRIGGVLDDGRLRITIEDTGVGFDPAAARRTSGVGLRSVSDRLRAHYGDGASVVIRSRAGEGATIVLDLPAQWRPELRRKAG